MKDLLKQLQELMPLAAQATEGPWIYENDENDDCRLLDTDTDTLLGTGEEIAVMTWVMSDGTQANAAFIAAARNLLTPENLTMIIGLLGNMESSFETNRVLVKRLFEIQGILENDLLDDTKLYLISETINPPKIAKR